VPERRDKERNEGPDSFRSLVHFAGFMLAIGLACAGSFSPGMAVVPAVAAYWDNLPRAVCLFARAPAFSCSDPGLGKSAVAAYEMPHGAISCSLCFDPVNSP